MSSFDVVATVSRLADADPATCDRDGLAELVTMSQRARAWLDALDVRIAVHARRLAESGACEAPEALLTGGGRRAAREAAAAKRRSAMCDLLPAVHDAMAAGTVSAGHADVLADVAATLDEKGRTDLQELAPALVTSATSTSVETYRRKVGELGRLLSRDDGVGRHERQRRRRGVRRWVDQATGMCHTSLVLDPLTDAKVASALKAATAAEHAKPDDGEPRTFDQLQADALVGLITGGGARHGAPEVAVLIDYDTLRYGLHHQSVAESSTGQPVPPAVVRRLACDADIIPIVLGGDGVALDEGRARRVATREQRRALRAMYRTCGHPQCEVAFDACNIHHVDPWTPTGVTDLDNLLPLCSKHHHLVHEGGWQLTLGPDRVITLRRPDGSIHVHAASVDVAPTGVFEGTNPLPRPASPRPSPARSMPPPAGTANSYRHNHPERSDHPPEPPPPDWGRVPTPVRRVTGGQGRSAPPPRRAFTFTPR